METGLTNKVSLGNTKSQGFVYPYVRSDKPKQPEPDYNGPTVYQMSRAKGILGRKGNIFRCHSKLVASIFTGFTIRNRFMVDSSGAPLRENPGALFSAHRFGLRVTQKLLKLKGLE